MKEESNNSLITKKNNYLPMVCTHVHSSGSFLDGCGKLEKYIQLAKEYNHPAISLTDHGNALMLFNFWKIAKQERIKPILGCEFYITTDIELKEPNRRRKVVDRDKHIIVLIKNDIGYKNFCRLNYFSFSVGFYYKPRITYEQLFKNKEGLIITTACAAGQVNQMFDKESSEESEKWFLKFKKEFGDDFYAEIQLNELNDKEKYGINQKEMNANIIKLAKENDVKIIIGGDTHYADKEDFKLQDILINYMMHKTETEQTESFIHAKHLFFHNSNDYFKFNKEFKFNYNEEFIKTCFKNSIEIANKCNFDFKLGKTNFPKFVLPKDYTNNVEYCTQIAYEGLFKKLKERINLGEKMEDSLIEEYEKRLDYEISIISNKNYIDYFLIVQDLIKWAKKNGIFVGAGRGSCAGSLLAYSLNITEIDPIKFNLYFERFLNPERNSFPDIDCDFAQGTREKVRKYLEDKYGKEAVFGVGTHYLYHPKSALQDVSRGLGLDSSFNSTLMMEVSKLEDLEEQTNLREYFDSLLEKSNITPTLRNWIIDSEEVIKWADKLLGQCRNIGTHAGGILICPGPIYDYIPVIKSSKEIVTAFREADGSGKDLSELGLLKLDILGLKTLNIINDCIEDIKSDLNIDITDKVRYVDLEDVNLFTRFKKGNNVGIFQMDGCLDENSLITMGDLKKRKLKDLKKGDIVISYNEEKKCFEIDFVENHGFTGIKNGFEIELEDGNKIHPSTDHFFLTNKGWKKASKLKEEDEIISEAHSIVLGASGFYNNFIKIKRIVPKKDIVTFDMQIKNNHNYIANNLVVHNSTQSRLIKSINPDSFDDIVAISAINRPGPLEAFSEVFGKWKRWEKENNNKELLAIEKERYPFEFMKEPLKKTYGCLLFQEQFMLMVVAAAGFSMGEADSFRRAIAWRPEHPKYHTVKKYFDKLSDGMKAKGYNEEDIEKFLEYCRSFMGYSFNKCLTQNHKVKSEVRGEIKILDVKIGEKILGYNSVLQKDEYNEVLKKYNNGKKDVFEIELETGEKFECTIEHKFLTKIGMLPLKEIFSKNLEIKTKYTYSKIKNIKYSGKQNTYDLEINSSEHNFYINNVCTSNSHSVSYSYISMQCLFFKTYFPAYFYANLLNYGEREEYQSIIASAIADGIEILNVSINKSKYNFKVEDKNKIRIGFKALKGFGDKANEELVAFNISQYDNISDILSLPFKKINSNLMQCLIDIGAFDEFGIEKEKIQVIRNLYKDKKIEKWFTRKKDALALSTMPESLFQFPEINLFNEINQIRNEENAWIKLINNLIPYINFKPISPEKTNTRAEEILGFSLATVAKLSKLITLGDKYPELNLCSLTARKDDEDLCYWFLEKKEKRKTKKEKSYEMLTITDGNTAVKCFLWENVNFEKGKVYISHLKKSQYGYQVIIDDYCSEIDL